MNKTKLFTKLTVYLVLILILCMPVSFALSINPDSIKSNVDGNDATIEWETDDLASGVIKYGKSTENIFTIPETGEYKQDHSVSLNDLEYGSKYYYTVESSDGIVTAKLTGWKDFTTILDKPQSLTTSTVKATSAKLDWQSQNAKSYNIYVVELDNDGKKIGNYEIKTTTTVSIIEISGLKPATTYKAKIAGVDLLDREGLMSEEVEFTTEQKIPELSFLQVLSITKNSAIVTWETDVPTTSKVRYDKDNSLDLSASDNIETTDHSVKLENLEEGKTYYYKVISGEKEENGVLVPLIESTTKSFTTLTADASLTFIDMDVEILEENKASVSWRTNLEEKCTLYYGIDDSFTSNKNENEESTEHNIILDDLLPGIDYFYKIKCGVQESEISSFTTEDAEVGHFLTVEKLPIYTTNTAINISGTIVSGSKLFIFLNDESMAKVHKVVNSTKFNEQIALNFGAKMDNIPGKNIITIIAWDPNMKKDTVVLNTIVDIGKPTLQINDLPKFTNEQQLNISGYAEPSSVIDIEVNNQTKAHLTVGINGTFDTIVSLANKNQTITIFATDKAGNVDTFIHEISVDKIAPKVTLLTELKGETHFKILTIEAETDPNSKVYVTNYGEYSGCEDLQWTKDFGECSTFIGSKHRIPGKLVSSNIDPLGLILGSTMDVKANSKGKFTIRVPLYTSSGLKVTGRNRIEFLVEDEAGNVGFKQVNINYKPGCPDWQINTAEIQTYPFNIYTKDFTDNALEGSAFIPIEYIGAGNPTNIRVNIHKDIGSIHESVFGNTGEVVKQEDGTDMVTVRMPKYSQLDPATRKIYVYVPVTVNKYTGMIKNLPDQLNVFLKARISYRAEGAGYSSGSYTESSFGTSGSYQATGYASCDVYPVLSYSIQKPLDFTKFLTPETINKTIKALDKTIKVSTTIRDFVQKAATYVTLGCAAMVAYNFLNGAFTSAIPKQPGECTPMEQEMETTYWLCDRILCPDVPPKCDTNEWTDSGYMDGNDVIGKDEWEKRDGINAQTQGEYMKDYNELHPGQEITSNGIDQKHFSEWRSKNKDHSYYDDLQGGARVYSSTNPVTGESHTFEYIDVKNRQVVDKKTSRSIIEHGEGIPIINIRLSELDQKAASCDLTDQTLIRARKYGEEELTPISGSRKIVSPDYFCDSRPPSDLGKPDDSFFGCYSENCPNFDNTKCFGTADINPPSGLWASTKCACLPGIKSHLDNLIKVMEGAKKCLQQALIGEVRGGFCERLLAQFICDLFTELILKALFGTGSDDTGIVGGISGKDGVSDIKTNSRQVSNSLSKRYGGIIQNKFGLSGDQLVNKFCIAAITMDWSVVEGMLNQVVDAIPVEPVAFIDAESRAHGYDPFNGRMNIGYNVYLGIVPGGRTQTEMYLECDPNMPNALCKPGERKPIPRTFRQLDKHSSPVDENILFVDSGALSWYNKIVLVMKYELGGEIQTEVIERPITKKGDLAFGCVFSIAQGITCQTLGLSEDQGGLIQAYPVGSGSYLSPRTTTFYPGNDVNLLLKVRNQFKEPYFYVRFDFDDPIMNTIEYKLPGSGSSGESQYLGEQMFNLWLDTIGSAGSSIGSGEMYNLNNLNFALDSTGGEAGTTSNGILDVQLSNAEQALLTIYPQMRTEGNLNVPLKPFQCMVWSNTKNPSEITPTNSKYGKSVRLSGNLHEETSGIVQQVSGEQKTLIGYTEESEVGEIVQIVNGDSVAKETLLTNIANSNIDSNLKERLIKIIGNANTQMTWAYDLLARDWITLSGLDNIALSPDEMNEFMKLNKQVNYYFQFKEKGERIYDYKVWITAKYAAKSGKPLSQITSQAGQAEQRLSTDGGGALYTKCLIPGDELVRKVGYKDEKVKATQVISIQRITATVVQKQEFASQLPSIKLMSGTKQDQKQFVKGLSNVNSGTSKTVGVTMTVLKDTNGNEQGDTPMLYEGRPQQFKFKYFVKEKPTSGNYVPQVEIIEPITESVNDFEELWIGANIQDESNQLNKLLLRITNVQKKTSCESIYNFNGESIYNFNGESIDTEKDDCKVMPFEGDDLLLFKPNAPSFMRFRINLENGPALFEAGSKDYYSIHIEVSDGEKTGKTSKGFRLYSQPSVYSYTATSLSSQGPEALAAAVGSNIVCLGSGGCSKWAGHHTPQEVILDPSVPQSEKLQNVIPGQYGGQNLPPTQANQQQQDVYGQQWSYDPNTDYSQSPNWNTGLSQS
jgi:hypothetical protein